MGSDNPLAATDHAGNRLEGTRGLEFQRRAHGITCRQTQQGTLVAALY